MNATDTIEDPARDGAYTRVARSREKSVPAPCPCLKRVRHLLSRGFACFATGSETRVDARTADSLCLTERHCKCSLFESHEAAERRHHLQPGHASRHR